MSHHLHTAMALNRTLSVVEVLQTGVAKDRAHRERARVEGVDAVSRLALQLRGARSEQALAVAQANALAEVNADLRRRLVAAEARAIRAENAILRHAGRNA